MDVIPLGVEVSTPSSPLFAGIELGADPIPDETTICRFRHLLEERERTAKVSSKIAGYLEELLRRDKNEIYGNKAYVSAEQKQKYEAYGVRWNVARKGVLNRPESKKDQDWTRRKSKIRAKGEHSFGVIKQSLGICVSRHRQKRLPTVFSLYCFLSLLWLTFSSSERSYAEPPHEQI